MTAAMLSELVNGATVRSQIDSYSMCSPLLAAYLKRLLLLPEDRQNDIDSHIRHAFHELIANIQFVLGE